MHSKNSPHSNNALKKLKKISLIIAAVACVLAMTSILTHDYVVKRYEYDTGIKITESEYNCLVENIYFEAGNQPMIGKVAVGYVTINRLFDSKFPGNVCKVVYQKTKVCQFSWTCKSRTKINPTWWAESEKAATFIANKYNPIHDPTMGATFYHADYVKPHWKNAKKTVTIEDHIFYRDVTQ